MTDRQTNVLLLGGSGQLGQEILRAAWPAHIRVHAPTRELLALTDKDAVEAAFRAKSYAAVINAAAFTAVDNAETRASEAFAVNATGAGIVAQAARNAGAAVVHISTDYVFDGALTRAYREDDDPSPPNVYGESKLAGERAVISSNARSVILRTAWLISPYGSNFLKTILRLSATGGPIRVVDDQIGNPTSAADLAATIVSIVLGLIDQPTAPTGLFNFVNAGEASWHELAQAIVAADGGDPAMVQAIPTLAFPTPAARPPNSRLDTSRIRVDYGIIPRPWRQIVPGIVTEARLKEKSR